MGRLFAIALISIVIMFAAAQALMPAAPAEPVATPSASAAAGG